MHRFARMQGLTTISQMYTMYYSGSYAIHGTYWHHRFGTPVSHGCVNVAGHARWLFNWALVGTPVVVHDGACLQASLFSSGHRSLGAALCRLRSPSLSFTSLITPRHIKVVTRVLTVVVSTRSKSLLCRRLTVVALAWFLDSRRWVNRGSFSAIKTANKYALNTGKTTILQFDDISDT